MNVIRNAAAVLFAVTGVLAVVALVTRTEPVVLVVAVLLAAFAGFILAVGPNVG